MKNLKKIIAVGMTVLVISTASAAALAATTGEAGTGNRYGMTNTERACTGTCDGTGVCDGTCEGTGVCDGTGAGMQGGKGQMRGNRDGSGVGRRSGAGKGTGVGNGGVCDGSCTAEAE